MDEESKIMLYKQLIEFDKLAKIRRNKLLSWEDYNSFDSKTAFVYAIDFRDRCVEALGKKIFKLKSKMLYLELPDIDLEGADLNGIYLHSFVPGYAKERNNGKKIFVSTSVNLNNTNCVINMATIRPIIVSNDGKNVDEISADIRRCNFRGCKVFGKFQNSKAKLIYTDENLPESYIQRLEEYNVPNNARITSDIVYLNMMERKNCKRDKWY